MFCKPFVLRAGPVAGANHQKVGAEQVRLEIWASLNGSCDPNDLLD